MRRYLPRITDEALLRFTLAVLILGGILTYFGGNIFIAVPPGHVGILWSRFLGGTITDRSYGEGMHIFLPWDQLTLYDVRAQHLSQNIEGITRDGLQVSLTLDVRYHLIIDQVGLLQQAIGPDYENVLLKPTAAAFARSQIARYTVEEVYSTQRSYIERVMLDYMRLNRTLMVREGLKGKSFLNYDAVFINQITLPSIVRDAIEHKVAQYEVTQEWQYRIQRERLESDRRLIEARASREVLDMLGNKLTDTFVRLRYVESLERLANSPNAKMIVTGAGGSNTPLIMGVDAGGADARKPATSVPDPAPPLGASSPPLLSPPSTVPLLEPEPVQPP
jgi:prohibitin 2